SYPCQQASDRLYYILAVWEQLGLCQETEKLYLTGNKRIKEEVQREVEKYIREVESPSLEILMEDIEKMPDDISLDLAAMLYHEREE
ncbi:MAG: DUF3822 family protein, partial [Phocaeicola sp.]